MSGEEAGLSLGSPSLPLSAGARPVDGELRNATQSCPILFPWVGFFIHLPWAQEKTTGFLSPFREQGPSLWEGLIFFNGADSPILSLPGLTST